jgi:flagellar motor component MotA
MPGFGGGFNEKPKTRGQKVAAILVGAFLAIFIGYIVFKQFM